MRLTAKTDSRRRRATATLTHFWRHGLAHTLGAQPLFDTLGVIHREIALAAAEPTDKPEFRCQLGGGWFVVTREVFDRRFDGIGLRQGVALAVLGENCIGAIVESNGNGAHWETSQSRIVLQQIIQKMPRTFFPAL
jgi:hypothetical protein